MFSIIPEPRSGVNGETADRCAWVTVFDMVAGDPFDAEIPARRWVAVKRRIPFPAAGSEQGEERPGRDSPIGYFSVTES